MDLGITGRTAIVTGASQGIGLAIAQEICREGCRTILVARGRAALDKAVQRMCAEGGDAIAFTCDVSKKGEVRQLFKDIRKTHGAPDILIYNNGGPGDATFESATDGEFDHAYRTLVMGFVWSVRECVAGMKERRWGRIVTISSICIKESHRDLPLVLHNLGRPAAAGVSKTLANQLGAFGITVNTIAPGTIDSGEGSSFRRTYGAAAEKQGVNVEELIGRRLASVPLKRPGRADEIAALCAFLCSERASFINGQVIVADGGRVNTLY